MANRGGTFMKERPAKASTSPQTENNPPAANQPLGGGDLGKASNAKPGDRRDDDDRLDVPVIVPGKPDGEVDTRP